MLEVSGNIARRGGGLASDGTFYLGVSEDQVNIETSMGLGKRWAPSADQKPLAIRVTAKANGKEVVVADVPLDGKANPPIGEFESVEELSPTVGASGFTVWNGTLQPAASAQSSRWRKKLMFQLYHVERLQEQICH